MGQTGPENGDGHFLSIFDNNNRKGTFINHMSMVIGREGSSEMLKICSEQGGRGPVKCSEFAQTKKLEQKIAFYSH